MSQKQIAVIGLGRFGSSVALTLQNMGHEVLGIDQDQDVVDHFADELTHAVVCESTDEDSLKALGLRNFDVAIVAIGNDVQASILTTVILKEMGVPVVVAKALSELHGRTLAKVGADRVIYPERDMGVRVAHQLTSPNLLDYIELSKQYTIAEMTVPDCLSGKSLANVNPRGRFGCSVVAINKTKGIVIAPNAEDVLNEKDVMVVIGTNEQIEQFQQSIRR